MRVRRRSNRLFALACVGACATACLPRGDPPSGRQVLADSDVLLAGFLPSSSDGTVRLLVSRLRPEGYNADLYVLSVPESGAPSERLLIPNVGWGIGCIVAPCFPSDGRGRLLVYADFDSSTGIYRLVRVDPVTGDRLDLGRGSSIAMSASGNRLAITRFDNQGTLLTLFEADDQSMVVSAQYALFVGEDFFYLSLQQELMRVVPGGASELVRAGVAGFTPQPTDLGPVLILSLSSSDPTSLMTVVLDPTTLDEISPPIESWNSVSVSPDRHWLVSTIYDSDAAHLRLVDVSNGTEMTFDPGAGFVPGPGEWRPGHSELWLPLYNQSSPGLTSTWIWKPGMFPVEAPGTPYPYHDSFVSQSIFTRDGVYWFSFKPNQTTTGRLTIQVGPADDPSGVRVDINPPGTSTHNYHPLADGRLLVEAYRTNFERSDVYAVDPATGQTRLLGEQGMVLVAGGHRALASLHRVDGRGDLSVIDLDSGGLTVLAAEFAQSALVEPGLGADQVPAGARVAFHFRARFDSPYDGIWIARLP